MTLNGGSPGRKGDLGTSNSMQESLLQCSQMVTHQPLEGPFWKKELYASLPVLSWKAWILKRAALF